MYNVNYVCRFTIMDMGYSFLELRMVGASGGIRVGAIFTKEIFS